MEAFKKKNEPLKLVLSPKILCPFSFTLIRLGTRLISFLLLESTVGNGKPFEANTLNSPINSIADKGSGSDLKKKQNDFKNKMA